MNVISLGLLIVALVVFALGALGIVAATGKLICLGLAFAVAAFVLERLADVTTKTVTPIRRAP